MSVDENCVLITGGTGKLGQIFVAGFIELGWRVIYTFRSESKAGALTRSLGDRGDIARLHSIMVDLTEHDSANQVTAALSKLGFFPTCLVNNARSIDTLWVDPQGSPTRPNWYGEYLFAVVVPYGLSQALLAMPGNRLENVVNIGSMYGIVAANPRLYDDPLRQAPIHYGTAKAALIQLTREMAVRYAKRGVRVNSVSYGGVEGRVGAEFKARYEQLCPAERMLTEDEVMGPVAFVASHKASGMTGHNLVVDGGWTAW